MIHRSLSHPPQLISCRSAMFASYPVCASHKTTDTRVYPTKRYSNQKHQNIKNIYMKCVRIQSTSMQHEYRIFARRPWASILLQSRWKIMVIFGSMLGLNCNDFGYFLSLETEEQVSIRHAATSTWLLAVSYRCVNKTRPFTSHRSFTSNMSLILSTKGMLVYIW